jgi:predicted hotdog family 3-hydroxylacyl-ACP dehydratase
MVMIDSLVSCKGNTAKAILKVEEACVFIRDGKMTESGMIEAIAQTAAARTGWLAHSQADNRDRSIPIGVVGSVKGFQLFFNPKVGDEMEMEVEVMHEFMNASVVKAEVLVEGKRACSTELKIFLVSEDPY